MTTIFEEWSNIDTFQVTVTRSPSSGYTGMLPVVHFTNPLLQIKNAPMRVVWRKDVIHFHQQNCAQLKQHTQLEVTFVLYAVRQKD